MLTKKQIPAIAILAVILVFSGGCESFAQKKQAARLNWRTRTAKTKISIAEDLFAKGQIDQARQTTQQCLKDTPGLPQAHLLMGKINLVIGRADDAQLCFEKVVELDASCDRAYLYLADIALGKKMYQRALDNFAKALAIQPSNPDYIIAVAQTYVLADRPGEALDLLLEKIRLQPIDVNLKVHAASVLRALGRTTDAIQMYNEALAIQPENTGILESLGYCCVNDHRWDSAAQVFEKLLMIADPEQAQNYLRTLAVCNMNNNRYGAALACYDKLSVSERDNPEIWFYMGQAALGAGMPEKALACADRALSLRPDWPDAVALKGCAEYLKNDYNAAIATFGKITSDRQFASTAWLMTALCYKQLGDTDLADNALGNAKQLKPDSKLFDIVAGKKT